MNIPVYVLIIMGVLAVAAIVVSNTLSYRSGADDAEDELLGAKDGLRHARATMKQFKHDMKVAQHRATACISESRFWKRTARNLGWVKVPRSQTRAAEVTGIRELPPANDA